MGKPRLKALRDAGETLGIMSKSTESTIRDALQAAGLTSFFNGKVVGKAIGFEGKAGIIAEMARAGTLQGCTGKWQAALRNTLLVDDDVMELERARKIGLQA